MAKLTPYQGHRSWAAWNVALYLNNEYDLYQTMQDYKKRFKLHRAAALMLKNLNAMGITRTPDGARYTALTIRLAMED